MELHVEEPLLVGQLVVHVSHIHVCAEDVGSGQWGVCELAGST